MNIVLDTNVLVSGLLSPFKAPGEIVRMVSSGVLSLCFDARIFSEYDAVLRRPKFGMDPDAVDALLEQIKKRGRLAASQPLPKRLPDIHDEPFLEVALAGPAVCLVTGNMKDFPASLRGGMAVLTPAEFLDFYRRKNS